MTTCTLTQPLSGAEIIAILDRAQNDIRQKGWYKAGMPSGTCLLVATMDAYGELHPFTYQNAEERALSLLKDENDRGQLKEVLRQDPVLQERLGTLSAHGSSVVYFNDHPDTTEQDIHELIERTKNRLQ